MESVKISTKGQVTIPRVVREQLKLAAGDKVTFIVKEDGTVAVEPLINLRSLVGFIKTRIKDVSIEDINSAISEEGSKT